MPAILVRVEIEQNGANLQSLRAVFNDLEIVQVPRRQYMLVNDVIFCEELAPVSAMLNPIIPTGRG